MDNDQGDVGDFGPAMRALTDKQRRFVWAIAMTPGISAERAAEIAGYGREGSDADRDHVLRQSGYRLLQDQRIVEAIRELAGKKMRTAALAAADYLTSVIANPDIPAAIRVRAADSLLDRCGLGAETKHTVDVTHRDLSGAAVVKRIRELALKLGIDPVKLLGGNAAPVIEATALPSRE